MTKSLFKDKNQFTYLIYQQSIVYIHHYIKQNICKLSGRTVEIDSGPQIHPFTYKKDRTRT